MAAAASLGHTADHSRHGRDGAVGQLGLEVVEAGQLGVEGQDSSAGSVIAMAAHLLAEPVEDLAGQRGHLGRLDPPGPGGRRR